MGSDFYAWTPSLGKHKLTATPYEQTRGGGDAGDAMTVRFTVVTTSDTPRTTSPPWRRARRA